MSEKITTSGWSAWVNLMPPRPTPGGTLHITGNVDTQSGDFAFLEKAVPQGKISSILLLTLRTETGTAPAKNPQTVNYTEVLEQEKQYKEVQIWHNGKIEAAITKIEEVH
jgi:hypothetical protein